METVEINVSKDNHGTHIVNMDLYIEGNVTPGYAVDIKPTETSEFRNDSEIVNVCLPESNEGSPESPVDFETTEKCQFQNKCDTVNLHVPPEENKANTELNKPVEISEPLDNPEILNMDLPGENVVKDVNEAGLKGDDPNLSKIGVPGDSGENIDTVVEIGAAEKWPKKEDNEIINSDETEERVNSDGKTDTGPIEACLLQDSIGQNTNTESSEELTVVNPKQLDANNEHIEKERQHSGKWRFIRIWLTLSVAIAVSVTVIVLVVMTREIRSGISSPTAGTIQEMPTGSPVEEGTNDVTSSSTLSNIITSIVKDPITEELSEDVSALAMTAGLTTQDEPTHEPGIADGTKENVSPSLGVVTKQEKPTQSTKAVLNGEEMASTAGTTPASTANGGTHQHKVSKLAV